ncbi:sugar ABC transporter substrate-binding protein [Paenibacillus macerans]|uniref:ABC transporter substrate-binding protein n=1 Tax=Paenibacillus macerans TaxID=44252 RepID=UPI002DBF1538|nr:sugar ABC transporter substrate-binding protein [Paenibacillus macerans]MEC0333205.1 sugar ABC transporter substrate-binding protein [Paenibacillus macerans]
MANIRKLPMLLGVLIFVAAVALAGCGGGNSVNSSSINGNQGVSPNTANPSNGSESAAETAGPANGGTDKEPVTLKYTFWGSPQEKKALEEATKKFTEKYPWITVNAVHIPESDYDTKLTAMVAAGETPDAGYVHGELGEAWQKEGKFINFNEMFAKDTELKKEDFLDYIWFNGDDPNYTWGISTAGETFALFYNKDLFEEAGVEMPPAKAEDAWTWDQFVEAAKQLTIDKNGKNAADPGFDKDNIKQFGVSFESWYGPVMAHIVNNEGDLVSEDGRKFALDQPEAVEAIQRLADLINVHHVAPNPVQAKSIPSQAVALQSKLVAMSMHGQWINLDLGAAKVNYDIGVLPKMKRSVAMGISGVSAMFKSTKHPEATWLLTKFLADPSGALNLYRDGLWMPTLKKWYTDPELVAQWAENNPSHPSGFKDAFLTNLLNNSTPSPVYYVKNFGKVSSLAFSALDPVWLGKQSAEEAMKEVASKVQPEIQGRYGK